MINNRKLIVTVGIALLSFIIVGAFWEAEYNPFRTPAPQTTTPMFPAEQAARLRAVIETALARPGVLTPPPAEKTIQQDTLQWTVPEYVVQLENPTLSSEIAKALTEAVYANGGRIFQTYLPAEEQKAIIVVGVAAFITHTITLTWNVALPAEMTPLPTPANAAGSFRAAIVIDDLGASAIAVQRLLEMPADFTFSILPQLEKSTEIATFLHEQQKETWLHLPMEPQGTEYPGQGAILANMPPEAIQQTITQDLESVPYVVGVSNHMGSRLTADVQTMQTVLETLRARQLFFLDSRTTPRTMGPARRISGAVIQALRHLGQTQVDAAVIRSLRRTLRPADKQQLLRDLSFAPAWVGAHLRAIAQGLDLRRGSDSAVDGCALELCPR
jgi:polysaccharide deacetylase 2 family uncharacterized protein YibQ